MSILRRPKMDKNLFERDCIYCGQIFLLCYLFFIGNNGCTYGVICRPCINTLFRFIICFNCHVLLVNQCKIVFVIWLVLIIDALYIFYYYFIYNHLILYF